MALATAHISCGMAQPAQDCKQADIIVDVDVLQGSVLGPSGTKDSGLGVVDTACALNVSGTDWFQDDRGPLQGCGHQT